MADPLRDKRQSHDTEQPHIPESASVHDYAETAEWVRDLREQQEQTGDAGTFQFDPSGDEYERYVRDINEALSSATLQSEIFNAIDDVGGVVISRDGSYITVDALVKQWNILIDELLNIYAHNPEQWQTLQSKKGNIKKTALDTFFRAKNIPTAFGIASKLQTILTELLQAVVTHQAEFPEHFTFDDDTHIGSLSRGETSPSFLEEGVIRRVTEGVDDEGQREVSLENEPSSPSPLQGEGRGEVGDVHKAGWEQQISQAKSIADIVRALELFVTIRVSTPEGAIEYTRDDIAKIITQIVWGGRDYFRYLPLSVRTVIEKKIQELDLVQFTFASQKWMIETTTRFDEALQNVETVDELWHVLQEFGGVVQYALREKGNEIPTMTPISVYELQALWDEMESTPDKVESLMKKVPEIIGAFESEEKSMTEDAKWEGVQFRKKFQNFFDREQRKKLRRKGIDSDKIEESIYTRPQRIEDGAPRREKSLSSNTLNGLRNQLRKKLAQEDTEIQHIKIAKLDDGWESTQGPWWYAQRYQGLRHALQLVSTLKEKEQVRDRFVEIMNERQAEALHRVQVVPTLIKTATIEELNEREHVLKDSLLPLNTISAEDILGVERYTELTHVPSPEESASTQPVSEPSDSAGPSTESPTEPPEILETPTSPEPEQEREFDWNEQEQLAQRFWERQGEDRREALRARIQAQLQNVIDAGNTEFRLTLRTERDALSSYDQERFAAHRMIARDLGFRLGDFRFEAGSRRMVIASLEPLVLDAVGDQEEQQSQQQPQEIPPAPEQPTGEPEILEPIEEERELTEEERYWQTQQQQENRFWGRYRNENNRENVRRQMTARIQAAINNHSTYFILDWRNQRQRFNQQDQDQFSAFRMIAHRLGYRLGDFEFATGRNNQRIVRARLDLLAAVAPTPAPQEQQPTPAPQEQRPQQQPQQPQETPEQRAMRERIQKIEVTADEVQEGRRKAIALGIDNPEIIKMLDHKEVQQNYAQLFGEIADVVTAKEKWFGGLEYTGPQAGHQTGERHLGTREQEVINKMIEQLGPNAQNIPAEARMTEDMCRDIFYSSKRFVLENAMLGKKLGQPYQDSQTGNAYAESSTRRERSRAKLSGALARTAGWFGLSLAVLATGWNPLLTVGVLTGARAVDGLLRHNKQRRNVNKWKEENYEAARAQLLHSLSFSVANYVENTNRDRIRGNQGPLGVDEYRTRFLNALTAENNALDQNDPRRLEQNELESRAARFALYYSMDDDAKTRYQEAMNQRSQSAQHGYHEFFGTVADGMRHTRWLGFTKQDRNRGVLWHNTSPRDKVFAGATALGIGLGMTFLRTLGVPGAMAAGAYSGWKFGGALADSGGIGRPWGGPRGRWGLALRTGRNAPETSVEQSLKALESRNKQVGEYEKTLQKLEGELLISEVSSIDAQLQPMLKMLAETQPYIENLKNHHEFAHQYERFKKMYTKVMHLKMLAEFERPQWSSVPQGAVRQGEASVPKRFGSAQEAAQSLHGEYTGFREQERTRSGMYERDDEGNLVNRLDLRNRNRRLMYKIGGAVIGGLLLWEIAHLREVAHAQEVEPVGPGPSPRPDTMVVPDVAIVGRGEGVEHVLNRQLGQNHDAFTYFSQRYGTTDRGNLAHLIARDYGYVDNAGHEVRVLDTGVAGASQNPAYWLHKTPQGEWAVGEYTYDPVRSAYTPFETHSSHAPFERPSDLGHEYDHNSPQPSLVRKRGSVPPLPEKRGQGELSSSSSPFQGEGRVRFDPLTVSSPQGIIKNPDFIAPDPSLPNTDVHGAGSFDPLSRRDGVNPVSTELPEHSHLDALRESIGVTGDIPGPVSGNIGAEEANILTSFHAIHKDADVENISKTLEHLSKDQGGEWNHIIMHDHHAWVRPVTDPMDIQRFTHGELSSPPLEGGVSLAEGPGGGESSSPSPLQGEGGGEVPSSSSPKIGEGRVRFNLVAIKFGASNPQTPDLVLEQLPKGSEKIWSVRDVLPNGARGHEMHDYTEWLKDHPIKGTDKDIGTVDVMPNTARPTVSIVEAPNVPEIDDSSSFPSPLQGEGGVRSESILLSYDSKKNVTPEWLDEVHTIIHDDASFGEVAKAVDKNELVEYVNESIQQVEKLEKYKGQAQSVIDGLLSDNRDVQKSAASKGVDILGRSAQDMINRDVLDQKSWHSWRVLAGIVEHVHPNHATTKAVFDAVERAVKNNVSD